MYYNTSNCQFFLPPSPLNHTRVSWRIFFLISKHSAIRCVLQFGAYKEDATIGWVHKLTSNPSLFCNPANAFLYQKKFHSERKIYYWSMTNFLPNLINASIKTLYKPEQNCKFEQFWNLNIFQIRIMMKSKHFLKSKKPVKSRCFYKYEFYFPKYFYKKNWTKIYGMVERTEGSPHLGTPICRFMRPLGAETLRHCRLVGPIWPGIISFFMNL
jgi:hypothetical protein